MNLHSTPVGAHVCRKHVILYRYEPGSMHLCTVNHTTYANKIEPKHLKTPVQGNNKMTKDRKQSAKCLKYPPPREIDTLQIRLSIWLARLFRRSGRIPKQLEHTLDNRVGTRNMPSRQRLFAACPNRSREYSAR